MGSQPVRAAAVNALQSQPDLSEAMLERVAVLLEDKDSNIRGAAVEVLQSQANLSEAIRDRIIVLHDNNRL